MKRLWVLSYPLSVQRRLIRLGGCPGWSEYSLGAQVNLLVLSCCGSVIISKFILEQYKYLLRLKSQLDFIQYISHTWENMSHLMTKPTKWHVCPATTQIFAVCMKKPCFLSYLLIAQRRLWSDWADAQANLSLRSAHSDFVGFVMRRLICLLRCVTKVRPKPAQLQNPASLKIWI